MPINRSREEYMEEAYSHIENIDSESIDSGALSDLNIVLKTLSDQGGHISDDDLSEAATSIIDIMSKKNIKDHPLFLFLPSIDMSFSILKNIEDKVPVVKKILSKYMAYRYTKYNTPDSLNILALMAKDRGSARKNGQSAINKFVSILGDEYSQTSALNIEQMENNEYALTDQYNKNLYTNLIDSSNLSVEEKNKLKNKKPDFLIKKNNSFYLIEHKHMKEFGGAQDKQFEEVISFIHLASKINEDINVYGFIDGVYFNKILDAYDNISSSIWSYRQNKLTRAIEKIDYFENEKGYYPIINTNEFKNLFKNN